MYKFLCAILVIFMEVTTLNSFTLRSNGKPQRETTCPVEIFSCEKPLNYEQTQQFLCKNDTNCPASYKCCKDSCFQHLICKKSSDDVKSTCPIENTRCIFPLNYSFTKEFLCNSNNQCPVGYACCADSCFRHKICKLRIVDLETVEITPLFTTIEVTPTPTTVNGNEVEVSTDDETNNTFYPTTETTKANEEEHGRENGTENITDYTAFDLTTTVAEVTSSEGEENLGSTTKSSISNNGDNETEENNANGNEDYDDNDYGYDDYNGEDNDGNDNK